jgi:hypothetical protein
MPALKPKHEGSGKSEGISASRPEQFDNGFGTYYKGN